MITPPDAYDVQSAPLPFDLPDVERHLLLAARAAMALDHYTTMAWADAARAGQGDSVARLWRDTAISLRAALLDAARVAYSAWLRGHA